MRPCMRARVWTHVQPPFHSFTSFHIEFPAIPSKFHSFPVRPIPQFSPERENALPFPSFALPFPCFVLHSLA